MAQTKGRFFEITVWILFCLTCFQLTFQVPYVIMIHGQRANLFSGSLCAVMLVLARIHAGRKGISLPTNVMLISSVLSWLVLLSALFGDQIQTSAIRGFILLASGLGGFFCAGFLLKGEDGKRLFLWLCFFILWGVLLLSLVNYVAYGDIGQRTPWNMNRHAITNLILMLSISPLWLLLTKSGTLRLLGLFTLAVGYGVFFLSGQRSAVLIPMGLTALAFFMKGLRLKHTIIALLLMGALAVLMYRQIPHHLLRADFPRVFFRIESYPLSWHIAEKHPWLGAGLLASREKFLEDYILHWPHIDKGRFLHAMELCLTPENILLTFMCQLGFPFTVIYFGAVMFLISRLLALASKGETETIIPPLALLLPLSGALVQNLIFDGLLYPQLCWFFHLLLGLIPLDEGEAGVRRRPFPDNDQRERPERFRAPEGGPG